MEWRTWKGKPIDHYQNGSQVPPTAQPFERWCKIGTGTLSSKQGSSPHRFISALLPFLKNHIDKPLPASVQTPIGLGLDFETHGLASNSRGIKSNGLVLNLPRVQLPWSRQLAPLFKYEEDPRALKSRTTWLIKGKSTRTPRTVKAGTLFHSSLAGQQLSQPFVLCESVLSGTRFRFFLFFINYNLISNFLFLFLFK